MKRPIDARTKDAAYRAWGWHLSHASQLERATAGAGAAYLRYVTDLLEQAQEAEASRLSDFPAFLASRRAG